MDKYFRAWIDHVWGRDGFKCECGCTKAWTIASRELVECVKCKKQVSPKSMTVFRHCKLDTVKIADGLVYFLKNRDCSTKSMSALLGVQWRTAHAFVTRCRLLCEQKHGVEKAAHFINAVRGALAQLVRAGEVS